MGFIAARQGNANGLGDWFDGTHTWSYNRELNISVDETGRLNPDDPLTAQLTQEQIAAAGVWVEQQSQQAAPAPDYYGTFDLGTQQTANGSNYTAANNPLLMSNPTSTRIDTGAAQPLNNSNFATFAAAQQFAAALGGSVVQDPYSVGDWNQTAYAIKLADGTTVNAGAIASILGNDAFYGNMNVKSGEIAKLFGAEYEAGIAEALLGGGSVDLQAGLPAPGYLPTPLSQSAIDAAKQPTTTSTPTTTTTPRTTTTTTTPPPPPRPPTTATTTVPWVPPPPSPTTQTGSPLSPGGLKVINDQISQFATQAQQAAQSALGDNWAIWLAAAVAAYMLLGRRNQE